MFRVVGCDASGRHVEMSVCAASEDEARAIAQIAGAVRIDKVSTPPPERPSRFPKLNGWVVRILACAGCLGITSLGAAIGWFTGNAMEPPDNVVHFHWFFGSIIGAIIGLVCGVWLLVACLNHD